MSDETQLKTILKQVLNTRVDEDTSQDTTQEWDSMNHLLIITEVEKAFNIRIPIEKSIELISYKKILDFIKQVRMNRGE